MVKNDRARCKEKKIVDKKKRDRDIELLKARYLLELPKLHDDWIPPSVIAKTNRGEKPKIQFKNTDESEYSFYELPLSQKTLKSLTKFKTLMRIQCLTIPHVLAGHDVLAEAPTGSGKTLCFVIPILEKINNELWNVEDGIHSMIITPTRELALQIFNVFALFKAYDTNVMVVFGGKFLKEEQKRIEFVVVLIGTPGRIIAHMESSVNFRIEYLKMLVLDEADKLIELGFYDDIVKILEYLPPIDTRQNLLFSATMHGRINKLGEMLCNKENMIVISTYHYDNCNLDTNKDTNKLKHCYSIVSIKDKINILYSFLCTNFKEKIIVFCSTQKQVRYIYETFTKLKTGAKILELHGGHNQSKRVELFTIFNNKLNGCTLITTDLLSRGIDFPAVKYIFQFDAPVDIETYVHRAGRTSRGLDSAGTSILLLIDGERKFLEKLQQSGYYMELITFKKNLLKNITASLRYLCAKNDDIKQLAIKFYQCYLKHYSLIKYKDLFDIESLLKQKQDLALSIGLVELPNLPKGFAISKLNNKNISDGLIENSSKIDSSYIVTDDKILKNQKSLNTLISKVEASKNKTKEAEKETNELIENTNNSNKRQIKDVNSQITNIDEDNILEDQTLTIVDDTNEKETLQNDKINSRYNDQHIIKALRKKRLVIKKDGTAKLKGMSKFMKTEHILYDSDDEAYDANNFNDIIQLINKDTKVEQNKDRELFLQSIKQKLE